MKEEYPTFTEVIIDGYPWMVKDIYTIDLMKLEPLFSTMMNHDFIKVINLNVDPKFYNNNCYVPGYLPSLKIKRIQIDVGMFYYDHESVSKIEDRTWGYPKVQAYNEIDRQFWLDLENTKRLILLLSIVCRNLN